MLGPCSDPGPVLSQPVPRPGMRFRKCYWEAAEVQHELLPCGVLESIFFPEVRNEAEGFWFHRTRRNLCTNGLPSGTRGSNSAYSCDAAARAAANMAIMRGDDKWGRLSEGSDGSAEGKEVQAGSFLNVIVMCTTIHLIYPYIPT